LGGLLLCHSTQSTYIPRKQAACLHPLLFFLQPLPFSLFLPPLGFLSLALPFRLLSFPLTLGLHGRSLHLPPARAGLLSCSADPGLLPLQRGQLCPFLAGGGCGTVEVAAFRLDASALHRGSRWAKMY